MRMSGHKAGQPRWVHLQNLVIVASPSTPKHPNAKRSSPTLDQRGSILAFRKAKWSIRRIAKELFVSKGAVFRFLAAPEAYGTTKRPGGSPLLDDRDQRHVRREASQGKSSSSRIKHDLKLAVSSRTIRRVIAKTPYLKLHALSGPYRKREKFNLDGPDCLQYYWHDLRKEEQTFMSRQNGGGSVMIWAGFSSKGLTDVAFLEGRHDSSAYCDTLSNYLMPFVHANHMNGFVFQQDNASIHTSFETKSFFAENDISLLSWPSLPPDMNPIENVWGHLARKVYDNGRQFSSRQELKNEIICQWAAIGQAFLLKLIASMKSRCIDVIQARGSFTKY
ncbi:hypothetical protein AeMF1_018736 [Aphanomyces euteiches]|nr:hypothetical protein AeMF1_018736 [Aphanomyces euteiches]